MKRFAALLVLALSASLTQAQRAPDPSMLPRHQLADPVGSTESATHTRAKSDEAQLLPHRHYTNADGNDVHSPTKSLNGQAPSGASAKCRDGSYSFSHHRRGTCSHHGGVAAWL